MLPTLNWDRYAALVVYTVALMTVSCGTEGIAGSGSGVGNADSEAASVQCRRMPVTDRFPRDVTYYKVRVRFNGMGPAQSSHGSVEDVRDRENLDYYLNFKLRNDIDLVVGEDTLSTTMFYREDDIVGRGYESFLIGYLTENDARVRQEILIESPVLGNLEIKSL